MNGTMEKLYNILCEELEMIANKDGLSAGDLDAIHKMVVTKEKLLRIEELEENLGYSNAGEWNASGMYARTARRGNSYRSRGGRYSGRRYSMADGRGMIADQIRGMLDDDSLSQADREVLQRAMEQINR